LNTTERSPWQQTRWMSCPRVIADTSFHLRCNNIFITLQNAIMHSCVKYLLLLMCSAFLLIRCTYSHTTYITYCQLVANILIFLKLNDLLHPTRKSTLFSINNLLCTVQQNMILRCFFSLNVSLHTWVKGCFSAWTTWCFLNMTFSLNELLHTWHV